MKAQAMRRSRRARSADQGCADEKFRKVFLIKEEFDMLLIFDQNTACYVKINVTHLSYM
jgi:hypothetical protein